MSDKPVDDDPQPEPEPVPDQKPDDQPPTASSAHGRVHVVGPGEVQIMGSSG